ncbi:MAG: hypothetical protein DRG33_00915 [Deltaproteobacteria bacterium]|nr:MAG: hypothetical protein DRG33_00915 [Deltaproteobacteria bacterium]
MNLILNIPIPTTVLELFLVIVGYIVGDILETIFQYNTENKFIKKLKRLITPFIIGLGLIAFSNYHPYLLWIGEGTLIKDISNFKKIIKKIKEVLDDISETFIN